MITADIQRAEHLLPQNENLSANGFNFVPSLRTFLILFQVSATDHHIRVCVTNATAVIICNKSGTITREGMTHSFHLLEKQLPFHMSELSWAGRQETESDT